MPIDQTGGSENRLIDWIAGDSIMPLTRVTITGADNETDPNELIRLSLRFPFVEWGVLVGSVTLNGCGPRFPSGYWIQHLVECRRPASHPVDFSLHVCGAPLRGLSAGDHQPLFQLLGRDTTAFQRVQLNWHGYPQNQATGHHLFESFSKLVSPFLLWDPEIIFQWDSINECLYSEVLGFFHVSGLFDRSGGAGIKPEEWPDGKSCPVPCGWAGGLSPDNIREELPKIAACAKPDQPYWIDFETHVRTGDHLDIGKVTNVLLLCEEFMANERAAVS